MNAIAERWIGGCRRELLDRTLIWNQAHLHRILRHYQTHHNQHWPHRSLYSAAPLKRYLNRWILSGTTSGGETAALIDRLRVGGVVLTYDPQDRTLRAGDPDAAVRHHRQGPLTLTHARTREMSCAG